MNDLLKLKRLADQQIKEKAKIEGKIETYMDRLKKFKFKNTKEASTAMKTLGTKIIKMKKTFSDKVKIFKDKYADELSKIS